MKFLFAFGLTMTVLLAGLASAQSLTGTPADPQFKYSMPTPPGVASPRTERENMSTNTFDPG